MLAAIEPMPMDYAQKRGTKTYFSSQAVETAHLQLIGLPPKPKTRVTIQLLKREWREGDSPAKQKE